MQPGISGHNFHATRHHHSRTILHRGSAKASSLEAGGRRHRLERVIREPTVNRPGLALAGFTRYFANKRLQVIGNAESCFLRTLSPEERKALRQFVFLQNPRRDFSRNLHPDKLFLARRKRPRCPSLSRR
jgi:serine kinase of HPr protein (carbohydrate metabolism regulator)